MANHRVTRRHNSVISAGFTRWDTAGDEQAAHHDFGADESSGQQSCRPGECGEGVDTDCRRQSDVGCARHRAQHVEPHAFSSPSRQRHYRLRPQKVAGRNSVRAD